MSILTSYSTPQYLCVVTQEDSLTSTKFYHHKNGYTFMVKIRKTVKQDNTDNKYILEVFNIDNGLHLVAKSFSSINLNKVMNNYNPSVNYLGFA